ncbi:MAG: hypothetical protein QW521_00655 [Desulfurococcaceae archaeon]
MDLEEHVNRAVVGGTWVFLSNLSISISGLIFLLTITKLIGIKYVGEASAAISAATVAYLITSASIDITVIREVASGGFRSIYPSLMLASLTSVLALALSVLLVYALGYNDLVIYASLYAFLASLSTATLSSLIGLEMFREHFVVTLIGSLAKLLVGIAFAFATPSAVAPLLGYLVHPLTALIASMLALTHVLSFSERRCKVNCLKSTALLALSNYPFSISNQLLTMLSIYIFAYLTRETIGTGILYASMMVALALFAVPYSILSAVLSIGTRRNLDLFGESLRIGLGVSTPFIVAVSSAPATVLAVISPELVQGASVLRILMLSLTPLAALTATVMKLNKEGRARDLATIGALRLAALIALLMALVRAGGIAGAAIAFFLSNAIFMPIALAIIRESGKWLMTTWCIHAAFISLNYVIPLNKALAVIMFTPLSVITMQLAKVITVSEIAGVLKTTLSELLKFNVFKSRERGSK